MTISIKPLTETNKTDWYALWQNYLTFYQTTLDDATTENTWKNIVEAKQIKGFGAFLEEQNNSSLVGIVHLVIHPNTWNTTACCYLEDLYVSKTVRGQGIGQALIEHVYATAKTLHCNRVYWVTNEDNINARHLYDKVAKKTSMIQYRYDI